MPAWTTAHHMVFFFPGAPPHSVVLKARIPFELIFLSLMYIGTEGGFGVCRRQQVHLDSQD
jgi:hypothetical protein